MIYWLHRLGAPLCRALPLWLSHALVSALAPVVFALWREKQEYAIRNMLQVLGPTADPKEARRLAARSFRNFGIYLVDMLRLEDSRVSDINRQLTLNGWEHFTTALAKGQGLIFVGGHIGNSDLAAAILAKRGFPVNVITDVLSPPRWDSLVRQAREALGLRVLPVSSAMLRAVRALRDRQILAFLIDRPMENQGVFVEFFGRRTLVPGGAAALALRSGASVLGAYVVRSGNSYVAHISPEIPPPATGDDLRDLEALTQHLFSWLEQVIRQYPDQWFMFRPMWPVQ
jgi:KDO2-lipid IV(A) lauroyltransferase